jgi:hypothetical protein
VREAALSDPAKRALLVRFLAASHQANLFLAAPANRACATRAIGAQLGVSAATAASEYAAATDPLTGEVGPPAAFNVSRQGLLNVIDVRGQFGGFAGAGDGFDFADAIVPGAGKLIDYQLRDEAVAVESSFSPSC